MMRILIALLMIVSIEQSHGQSPTMSVEKTALHQNIKGTQIWMIPPKDFKPSKDFKGFKDTTDPVAMIMFTEMKAPFEELSKGFKSGKPLSNNMVVTNIKELRINNLDALFINIEQPSNDLIYEKHILLMGDSSQSFFLNGAFIKDSVALGIDIKKSLESVYYDENQVVDSRGSLDYTIDESGTKLKFSSVMGNALIFSVDGKTPTQSPDKLSFIVDKSFANAVIENKKLFCIARLKKLPYASTKMDFEKGVKDVEIDGLEGYELFAKGYDKSSTFTGYIHQIILFSETNYIILVGTYDEETTENMETLNKIARTFKRK